MKKQNFLRLLILLMLTLAFTTQSLNAAPKNDNGRKNAAQSAELKLDQKQYSVDELKALANQYRNARNNLGLVAVLKIWTEKEPRRFDIRLELGAIYISQNKLIDAAQVLNEASSIIPSDEAPHRLLAQIYKSQGNDSLRYLHLVKAASLAKRNWENQYNLGMYHASKGQNQKAEAFLINTMELKPGFAAAKFEYAKLMLEKDDVESAFRKFDEALLIEPENYVYMAFYAYAAAISGRATVSSGNIREALKFAPRNPQALRMAGLIHMYNGNISAAEKSLRAAHRYSPTDALVIESLGDALAADFKFKEACANYLTAWQTAGYSERIAFKLGKTLSLDRKHREAKDFLEAIASKSSKNGEALYCLAEVYCELGDMNRANALVSRLSDGKNAVWRQLAQGRIHEARSDSDLARTAYSAAYIIAPSNALVNASLGRMLFKQGEIDSAIAFFEAAGALDPANINNIIDKARAYEKKGDHADAIS
ncbi:MAG: tetratricopeptide repeat protein, partial [Chitinispirillales bacterium]|nr:tetratricopeptide repeat protein [Chitinispirillales bacterium]